MTQFPPEDFGLHTKTAKILYYDYAERMPIFDYHCHLPAEKIAVDHRFSNLTQIWLDDDHYKWRAMRAIGVAEEYITGGATDYEKFEKWAQTVPFTLCNPLYLWTHLELKRYFGIEKLLNPESAREIYDKCAEILKSPEFSVRNLMRKMNVKVCCTTNDPLESLEHHQKLADDFEIKVLATWRPDRAMAVEDIKSLNNWIDKLAELVNIQINSYSWYLEALNKRHEFFHSTGCRLSDHGLQTVYAVKYTAGEIESIFQKIRLLKPLDSSEQLKFKSALLVDLALMDHQKDWVQQLHIGALRKINTRLLQALGPDAGCDSIGDFPIAESLAKFLDRLDAQDKLPKTILYNVNSRDNELLAAMVGSFQDGSVPGKIQYGPAWWFCDTKDGIERQISALSNIGLLSRFVGMITDSRSFLSYPRHEYFRRILCNILGNNVEIGELPKDIDLLGSMIEGICFNNAAEYFKIDAG
jgi:glucuronate isomerase